jgi:hypothetical protein
MPSEREQKPVGRGANGKRRAAPRAEPPRCALALSCNCESAGREARACSPNHDRQRREREQTGATRRKRIRRAAVGYAVPRGRIRRRPWVRFETSRAARAEHVDGGRRHFFQLRRRTRRACSDADAEIGTRVDPPAHAGAKAPRATLSDRRPLPFAAELFGRVCATLGFPMMIVGPAHRANSKIAADIRSRHARTWGAAQPERAGREARACSPNTRDADHVEHTARAENPTFGRSLRVTVTVASRSR